MRTLKEFFESVPPGRMVKVSVLAAPYGHGYGETIAYQIKLPELELHCESETCDGLRFFYTDHTIYVKTGVEEQFITYRCRNCGRSERTYAVRAEFDSGGKTGALFKFGEVPAFGPPTPARVVSLVGPEKDYYLKGRRAESQGLGIAAFAYYRRVVENQKNRIFDEIIRVCEKIGGSTDVIAELKAAKGETQFSKAVALVKHGVPQVLLIKGHHDPLTLLHSALSGGLHNETDEECLELAASIRVVLEDLAERLSHALKEEAELSAAVSRLLKGKAK